MRVQTTWKIGLVAIFLVFLVSVLGAPQFEIHLPGGALPEATAGGDTLDFGSVPIGQTKTASYTFKITETSETSGTVTGIGFAGGAIAAPPFSLRNLPALPVTLPPGGSITFTVAFTPTAVGTFTSSFTITAQGGVPLKVTRQTVTVRGQGTRATFEAPSTTTTQPTITWPGPTAADTVPTEDLQALKTQLDAMELVLNEACQKVDNLAGILGEWIVGRGTRFQVEPGMTGANPVAPVDGIKPEIEGLERRMNEILSALGDAPPVLPPVDVTATSGDRFRRFLSLADDLLVRTAQDVRAINPPDEYTSGILDRFSDFSQAGRGEVAQLIELSRSIPLEIQAQLDSVVVEGAPELLYEITTAEGKTPKLQVEMDGGGNEVVSTILSKAGTALSSVPIVGGLLNAVLDDAAKLFEGNSELAQLMSGMALAQLELELKLDAIVRGLFGVSIDEAMDETQLRERLRQVAQGDIPQRFTSLEDTLDELRQKLDNLGWWLGRLTTGTPIGVEPDSTNVLPETDLWTLLAELEAKLDLVLDLLADLQAALAELQATLDAQRQFLEARFAALDATLGALRADLLNAVGAVGAAVAANGQAIAANANAIAAVQAGVNANANALTALANQLDALDTALDDLQDWLSDEFDAVDDTQQDILDDLFDLSMDVADNADAIADNADAIADNADALTANANAIAAVQAGVNASNTALTALSNSVSALQSQVNANGMAISKVTDELATLREAANRIEDKLNRLLDLPAAPDRSRIASQRAAVVGEPGAVSPGNRVTVTWPSGAISSVDAGSDGSFTVPIPAGEGPGKATVTQTDPQGEESAPITVDLAP